MKAAESRHPATTRRGMGGAWRRNGLVWLVLMVLLACTIGAAYLPLGGWNLAFNVALAIIQAALVGLLSMGLSRASAIDRLAAASGFLFVTVLFVFLFADLLNRL